MFIVWRGTEEEAHDFTNHLNDNNWGLYFTENFDAQKISFLDLMVSLANNKFSTSTFFKKVDSNSYLSYDSGHYTKWKTNIPFGQYRTEDDMFIKQSKILQQRFREKNNPDTLIKTAYKKVKKLIHKDCLIEKTSTTTDPIITIPHFITTYNTKHGAICRILNIYWYLIKDPYLSKTISANLKITYRRPPSLKNRVAPSKVKKHAKTSR